MVWIYKVVCLIWLFSFWILGRRRKDVLPCLAVPNGWSRSIEFSKHPIPISAVPSRNVSTKCNIYLCCHNHTNINGKNILSRPENFLTKNNLCHSIQTMWNVQKEHNRQKDNLKWLLIFICRAFIWKKTKISSFGRLQFQRNSNILFVNTILNCQMFK